MCEAGMLTAGPFLRGADRQRSVFSDANMRTCPPDSGTQKTAVVREA